jgi:hypothetical protein
MIPDPYDGKTFVFSTTPCTDERKLFFKRMNEILGFFYVTSLCYHEYERHFNKSVPNLPLKENTPIKIRLKASKSVMMPARRVLSFTKEGLDILARQIFVMIYGSFETYLYQLFERSFPTVGLSYAETILDKSRDILMLKQWDGKFCAMNDAFNIGYRASDLISHFSNFEMDFEGKRHSNPLNFLDELAQIRHRIVHASSILEKDKMIFIDLNNFHGLFGFFFLLTGYVDNVFAKKFNYTRQELDPAKA